MTEKYLFYSDPYMGKRSSVSDFWQESQKLSYSTNDLLDRLVKEMLYSKEFRFDLRHVAVDILAENIISQMNVSSFSLKMTLISLLIKYKENLSPHGDIEVIARDASFSLDDFNLESYDDYGHIFYSKEGWLLLMRWERYPCFDDDDYASETRKYINLWLFKDRKSCDAFIGKYSSLPSIKGRINACFLHEDTPRELFPMIYVDGDSKTILVGRLRKKDE